MYRFAEYIAEAEVGLVIRVFYFLTILLLIISLFLCKIIFKIDVEFNEFAKKIRYILICVFFSALFFSIRSRRFISFNWKPFGAASHALIVIGGLALSSLCGAIISLLLAKTAMPYVDMELAKLDAFIGFDWHWAMALLAYDKVVLEIFSFAYDSIFWQPVLLALLLSFTHDLRRLYLSFCSYNLSLILSLAIFPFLPAISAFNYYGVTPSDFPSNVPLGNWHYVEVVDGIRSGIIQSIGASEIYGIITMPSFHASAAIVFAYGFLKIKFLNIPMVALNILMLISTIPVGSHYFVDVIAGAVIAAGFIALLRAYAVPSAAYQGAERRPHRLAAA